MANTATKLMGKPKTGSMGDVRRSGERSKQGEDLLEMYEVNRMHRTIMKHQSRGQGRPGPLRVVQDDESVDCWS
jgi:hypothetical protein